VEVDWWVLTLHVDRRGLPAIVFELLPETLLDDEGRVGCRVQNQVCEKCRNSRQ
jgi:hypothetical protein